MLRKQINGTTLRGTDGIDRTLNAVTLSEDEKKKIGELDFLQNDILLADGVKAVAANDKVGFTEEEVQEGLAEGKWLPIRQGVSNKTDLYNGSIVGNATYAVAGNNAHAEGARTNASGDYSHAEGFRTVSNGLASHAEGYGNYSNGEYSHAEGYLNNTYVMGEHAEGVYNFSQANMFISTIGVGDSDVQRKNGFAVDPSGNIFILGLGGYEGQSPEGKTSLQTLLLSYQQRISDLETKIAELENTAKSE